VSNGETILRNEDSINVRSYILFFSFRRFFMFFFNLLARSLLGSLLPLALASSTRAFSLGFLFYFNLFMLFFAFYLPLSLTHTRTHFLPLSRVLHMIDAKCPYTTLNEMCVCAPFSPFYFSVLKSIHTIAFCSTRLPHTFFSFSFFLPFFFPRLYPP